MLWNFEAAKVYNVKDMYKQAQTSNLKLLSDYTASSDPEADFWYEYRTNSGSFDRLFMRRYSSLIPLDQNDYESLSDIVSAFRSDVSALLLANKKRYSELWRVNSIADDTAYSLVNNVDVTETRSRTEGRDGEHVKGSETITDTTQTDYGAQTVTQDTETTFGSQTITDDNDVVKGQRSDTTINSKSAYNESTYSPTDKTEFTEGEQTDHIDNERTVGSHTDNQETSTAYGAHIDRGSNSRVDGQRTDTDTLDITESESIHKVGNMGVQTVDDMLNKHWENWDKFKFYDLVFSDIARNLLRGC